MFGLLDCGYWTGPFDYKRKEKKRGGSAKKKRKEKNKEACALN
jgi:hypothetical protein